MCWQCRFPWPQWYPTLNFFFFFIKLCVRTTNRALLSFFFTLLYYFQFVKDGGFILNLLRPLMMSMALNRCRLMGKSINGKGQPLWTLRQWFGTCLSKFSQPTRFMHRVWPSWKRQPWSTWLMLDSGEILFILWVP